MENEEYIIAQDREIEEATGKFFKVVKRAIELYGFWGSVSRYILMRDEFRRFVKSGKTVEERTFRKDLLKKFARIQKKVTCGHSPFQFVLMAEYILSLDIPGAMVECGCYKGGSTAKLSLLANHTHRKLYVFDSFQGLPEPKNEKEAFVKQDRESGQKYRFQAGQYRGTLDEVKRNVANYGFLDVCEFIPGFFSESLDGFYVNPAFVFIDVDLVSSARDCIKALWPLINKGGYFFTHEAMYPSYIEGILDKDWWKENLNLCPPVIYGAGSGLSPIADTVAYIRK
ncbi:MAG: TylF/MycF family methyltransferase [Candidatus Aminicenantes bacterium]|nr:TylF/MycF family methyltransferase [Candidatus Aminicenantes bacterium]MDH5385155.1 TylF/MycF family methyltransferase [Candidatus Aminicenantes bacterium]